MQSRKTGERSLRRPRAAADRGADIVNRLTQSDRLRQEIRGEIGPL